MKALELLGRALVAALLLGVTLAFALLTVRSVSALLSIDWSAPAVPVLIVLGLSLGTVVSLTLLSRYLPELPRPVDLEALTRQLNAYWDAENEEADAAAVREGYVDYDDMVLRKRLGLKPNDPVDAAMIRANAGQPFRTNDLFGHA